MSTKMVYPVIFHKTKDKVPYFVEVPDLDVMTQGKSIQNAIEMARERICIKVIQLEKEKTKIPNASELSTIITNDKNAFVSLVDADIEAYKLLTKICLKTGETEEILEILNTRLDKEDNGDLYYCLARVYKYIGDSEQYCKNPDQALDNPYTLPFSKKIVKQELEYIKEMIP